MRQQKETRFDQIKLCSVNDDNKALKNYVSQFSKPHSLWSLDSWDLV